VDVWVVFWVDVFEFGMEGLVSGAGQAGKSLVDLYIWITNMEGGCSSHLQGASWELCWYLVCLGREALPLYKSSEGFCIAKVFCS
jgi:hypothetical protein